MKIVWLQGIYMQIMSNHVTFKKYIISKNVPVEERKKHRTPKTSAH